MKKQLSVLLSLFACMYFISCKKESVSIPESKSISNATIANSDVKASNSVSVVSKMNETKVPFKGTYTTKAQVLQRPPFLRQRITGTGQATHLGQSTFVALSTVNLTTAPPFSLSGTAIFSAANGDEFYTTFSGTSTPIGGGRSNVVITHTITGGTGRFENATGSFTGTTIANPALPTGSISYEGNISY